MSRSDRARRAGTLGRRLRTIPLVILGTVTAWLLLPVLIPVAVAVDVIRALRQGTPWMGVRLVGFLIAYLTAETVGLLLLGGAWAVSAGSEARLARATYAVQRAWSGFVFWAVRRLFGLRLQVEGTETITDPPYLLVARHTSIVDNLLPSHLITGPHGIHVRYVMKEELLLDPALDVAGNRLPNVFVRRGRQGSDREVAAIRQLAETLTPNEAVLIYPEGTRFKPEKQQSALLRLERRSPRLHELASRFRTVLPPQVGGVLALLEGCAADVVVMAHRGLDGFARVADIWRGAMVRQLVEVRFWRVPRTEIPEDRSERVEWLFGLWAELDEWVAATPSEPRPAEA